MNTPLDPQQIFDPALKGTALVLQPDEGESWWQPQPAGGHVREHWHSRQEEILFCFEGEGLFIVDGVEHRAVPGTTVFAGRWVRHRIVNTGKVDFKMTWTFLPPGLHEFAEAIGRPRRAGDPAPAPFARPADTLAVERAVGFGPKIGE